MATTQGTVRFDFLSNRSQIFDTVTYVANTMFVFYKDLLEFDVYRWDSSAYVKYIDESGVGITLDGDMLSIHYGDSVVVDTIGATYAESVALAAYGATWELELYRSNVLGGKKANTIADAWLTLLTMVMVEPTSHTITGVSVHDHVRSDHYSLRELIKPYLGFGGVKDAPLDYDAHVESIVGSSVPEHEWVGTSLRFKEPDGSWGGLIDLSGMAGVAGVAGTNGANGVNGTMPAHQWSGTSIRFQNANGSWGGYTNLKGATGASGSSSLNRLTSRNNGAYASLSTSQRTQQSMYVSASGYYLINAYMTCYAHVQVDWVEAAIYEGGTLRAHGANSISSVGGSQAWCTVAISTIEYVSAGTTLYLKSKCDRSGVTRGYADLSAVKVG